MGRWLRLRMDAVDVLALEYEQLKEEQRLRIGTRDNLLYATLGSQAVMAALALQTGQALLLLMVPPVCLILGWTYFVNDNRITAISRYIESVILTALAERIRPDVPVLMWERLHRTGRGRRSRKVWQASVDLLTFVVSTVVALTVAITTGPMPPAAKVVAAIESLATCLLAYQMVAQVIRDTRASRSLAAIGEPNARRQQE